MELGDGDSLKTLTDAYHRGKKLLDKLVEQQAELAAQPASLSAGQLAEGKMALANAIASTHRMLESLEEAMRIASTSSH